MHLFLDYLLFNVVPTALVVAVMVFGVRVKDNPFVMPSRSALALKVTMLCGFLRAALTMLAEWTRDGVAFARSVHWYDVLVRWFMLPPALDPAAVRSTFTGSPDYVKRPLNNHTHPEEAARRSGAAAFADVLASSLGLNVYCVQKSRADERHGRVGQHGLWTSRDLRAGISDPEPARPLRVYVDDDYYRDMPAELLGLTTPVFIYTVTPTAASRETAEYVYKFKADGSIYYRVNGGAQYEHKLWSYGTDYVAVNGWCGIVPMSTHYHVERRMVGQDHSMIMLVPIGTWRGLGALLARYIAAPDIKRMAPVNGDHVRFDVFGADGMYRTTAHVDEFACATIPVALDDTLAIVARTSQTTLTHSMVQAVLAKVELPDKDTQTRVLLDFHRRSSGSYDVVIAPRYAVRRYQMNQIDFDAKPSVSAICSPFIDGCYAPDNTKGNEEASINGRVINIRSDVEPTDRLVTLCREFAKLLAPAGTVVPVDEEEVWQRQDRPSQQAILRRADHEAPGRVTKTFLKKETYSEAKDPRNISQIDGPTKRDYSMYLYAVADVLKQQQWYAFGKKPRAISQAVADVASRSSSVVETDCSRMDGRVSPAARTLERIVALHLLAPEFHEEFIALHERQFNLRGRAHFGTEYDTGTSRASGSPETAAFNSILNAAMAYATYRMMNLSKKQSWDRLGLYGGDDGLSGDIDSTLYADTARMFGQKLEAKRREKGEPGLKFLARIYGPGVWHGDPNNCADIMRQLLKLHTTPGYVAPGAEAFKLREKALSISLTDAHTPILGPWAHKVLDVTVGLDALPTGWWSQFKREDQYCNVTADWMLDLVERLNIDSAKFTHWLETVDTIDALLSPPCISLPVEDNTVGALVLGTVDAIKTTAKDKGKQGRSKKSEKRATHQKMKKTLVAGKPARGTAE